MASAAWRKVNQDRQNAATIAWRKANPNLVADSQRRCKFGPKAVEHYKAMLKQQKGLCAICRHKLRPPMQDHNHETDQLRGLLCHGCNRLVGCLEHPLFDKALAYLRKWAEGTK